MFTPRHIIKPISTLILCAQQHKPMRNTTPALLYVVGKPARFQYASENRSIPKGNMILPESIPKSRGETQPVSGGSRVMGGNLMRIPKLDINCNMTGYISKS